MKVRLTLTGTAPMLMHNIQLSDPLNAVARAMKEISSKRKKTDEDQLRLAELEFKGGLYITDQLGPYVPGVNVEKCLVEGARITKQGKQVERGLFVEDNECPLLYQGPRTAADLWADEDFRSRMAVKVGTSRVQRTRPIFRQWAVEATAEVDPALLNLESVASIATDAGSMVGLGDFRPRYGRFVAQVEAL